MFKRPGLLVLVLSLAAITRAQSAASRAGAAVERSRAALPPSAFATTPEANGSLTGIVRDSSGAALPGVSVTIVSGNVTRTSTTDASGRFRFAGIPAAVYRVRAVLSGFGAARLESVTVNPGTSTEIAMRLESGATASEAPPPIPAAPPPPPPVPKISPPPHAKPPAGDGAEEVHRVSRLYWNRWIEDREKGRVDSLPVPDPADAAVSGFADLYIDLSTLDLSAFDPGRVLALPANPILAEELSSLPRRAGLQVLPVVVGDQLELGASGRGWRKVNVDVEKLRNAPPPESTPGEAPPPPAEDAFRAAARRSSLLEDPAWNPIVLPVRGIKKGCAAIALSVWEENFDRPLDQRVFPVSVGGAPCGPVDSSALTLPSSFLGAYAARAPDYAAALHVFEMNLPSGETATRAVFVRRGDPEARVWSVDTPLSQIPDLMKPDLNDARTVSPYAFGKATTVLMDALFNTANPGAAAAWNAMKDLAASGSRPSIYARIVTASGDNLPLPLGLVDVGLGAPLGALTTIVSPMPVESFGGGALPCIDRRVIVTNQALDPLTPRPATEAAFVGNDQARAYLKSPDPTDGVLLVVFGHHGAQERLLFGQDSLLTPDVVNRRFSRSVSFLMVCGGAEAGTLSTTWLKKFNRQGIAAAVASPFEIETDRAVEFLHSVQNVLAAIPSGSSVSFSDVYFRAIQDLVDRRDPKAYESFEYVVVGDGSIPICGERP